MLTFEMKRFFLEKPHEARLFSTLLERMASVGEYTVCVQKTQISFYQPKLFLCVSMRWKNSITITFGLPFRMVSQRIAQVSEPYPQRWTHHVRISASEEIDDELMGWIVAAYDFAQQKGKVYR